MIDVARYADCSRATLYRYFPNQDALHHAFVHRATLRIAAQLGLAYGDGSVDALVERILAGIAAVRSDPLLSVWFAPENMAVPIRVSQSSELLRTLTLGAIDHDTVTPQAREDLELRAEWLLRSIISLLAMPGRDERSERTMVESFVVPVLTGSDAGSRQP